MRMGCFLIGTIFCSVRLSTLELMRAHSFFKGHQKEQGHAKTPTRSSFQGSAKLTVEALESEGPTMNELSEPMTHRVRSVLAALFLEDWTLLFS